MASEKQISYINDLITSNMINVTRSIPGAASTEQSRKIADFFVGKLRAMAESADSATASAIIDAVKSWPSGPRAVMALVKPDMAELKAYVDGK